MIGLGIMGSAMAANLMRDGYAVVGSDVVAARRRAHERAGGRIVQSAREVGEAADIVICSLPSTTAMLAVAKDLAGARRRRRIVIETSTLPIAVKEEARSILAASGATLLDCPLSGTGAQARVRDLAVYASGPRTAYRAVEPVMKAFARAPYYVGPFGAGSKMKFVANLLVAIHNVAAAEAMVLAMKAGLDPALTYKVISDGGGSSRMLQVRGPMMVRGDYSDAMIRLSVWGQGHDGHRGLRASGGVPDAAVLGHGAHLRRGGGDQARHRGYGGGVRRAGADGEPSALETEGVRGERADRRVQTSGGN